MTDEPPFEIGDYVTSDFYGRHRDLVRRVTAVRRSAYHTQTGWMVSADAGGPDAPSNARPIHAVDSAWFKPSRKPHPA